MLSRKRYRRNISSNNPFGMVLIALTHRQIACAVFRLLWTVAIEFFGLQFQTRLRLSVRPVVKVDHDLDVTIPFLPEYIDTYLSFTSLWIKSLYFIYREFGQQTLSDVAAFIDGITQLNIEAGRIYRIRQSTSHRPKYLKSRRFKLIHAVDPHLHCIPSLHVLTVLYNYVEISRLLNKHSDSIEDFRKEIEYLYSRALTITESVLFVKQHTVNCIPASLFVITQIVPIFAFEDSQDFVRDLFRQTDFDFEAQIKIKTYMLKQLRLFRDSIRNGDAQFPEVLLNFLQQFEETSMKQMFVTRKIS